MKQDEFNKIIKACRFCLMCRHLCTVGNITYAETNTPRGHALVLDCWGSEALRDNDENRSRLSEIVFECCYCGHCQNNCVSSYMHPDAIMKARADLSEYEIPETVREFRALVIKNGGFYENQKQLSGKTDVEYADVLLYTGAFVRNESQEIAEAAISVFEKSGINYTLLSNEICSGIDAYLVGLQDKSQLQLDEEILKINELRPDKIVCLSPLDQWMFSGGVSGLNADDLKIPLVSFAAFILDLIRKGALKIPNSGTGREDEKPVVAYHDSDMGGRYLRDFDAPRDLINEVRDVRFQELFWSKGEAGSAGENGAIRFLNKDLAMKVARKRLDQIEGRGIDMLVTDSGPAKAQLNDSQSGDLKIFHIAEFINNYI